MERLRSALWSAICGCRDRHHVWRRDSAFAAASGSAILLPRDWHDKVADTACDFESIHRQRRQREAAAELFEYRRRSYLQRNFKRVLSGFKSWRRFYLQQSAD